MIDKNYGKHALICDNCGDGAEEFDTYTELQKYIRNNGWQTRFINGEWIHYCPDCKESDSR